MELWEGKNKSLQLSRPVNLGTCKHFSDNQINRLKVDYIQKNYDSKQKNYIIILFTDMTDFTNRILNFVCLDAKL